jgi:hypothetical protein
LGEVLEASCPACGFRDDTVPIGEGMMGGRIIPLSCSSCGEIRTVQRKGRAFDEGPDPVYERVDPDRCPTCRGAAVLVTEDGGPCPQCGAALHIEHSGLMFD